MTFTDTSRKVLSEFISSVLYIDDNIFSSSKKENEPRIALTIPTRETAVHVEESIEPLTVAEGAEIDVRLLTKSFADHGIVCGLLEPSIGLEPRLEILEKPDVLILDWSIHRDQGKYVLEIIKKIETDLCNGIHLLVIWTNESNYEDQLRKIQNISDNFVPDENDPSIINIGKSRILYLGKGKKEDVAGMKYVSEDELPKIILERMSEMTGGLVSNTVIHSISVLKKCSAKILGHFNTKLDGAYLAHRAMCPNPEDAENLLLNMISDTFKSLIFHEKVQSYCNSEMISRYIMERERNYVPVSLRGSDKKNVELNLKDYINWQSNGYPRLLANKAEAIFGDSNKQKSWVEKTGEHHIKEWAERVFEQEDKQHLSFARLSTVKNIMEDDYVPFLSLGTVVEFVDANNNEHYMLCIQQRCDSVRIGTGQIRGFLFLPISETKEGSAKDYVSLVIKAKRMYVSVRTFDVSIIKFQENKKGFVIAAPQAGRYIFKDFSGNNYFWHCDLKDAIAQQISEKFCSNLSRVGLEQSEWLRR